MSNMLRVAGTLRRADLQCRRFVTANRYDLAETGYGRALLAAMSDMDRLQEVEVLKSLGDLNVEKGRLYKTEASRNLQRGLNLYRAALLRCKDPGEGESLQHRVKLAEKLRQETPGPITGSHSDTKIDSVVMTSVIFQDLDKKRGKGGNMDPILNGYTKILVEGIADRNRLLEVEAMKSLGDVNLKRGRDLKEPRHVTKATALYSTALERCDDPHGKTVLTHRLLHAAKVRREVAEIRRRVALKGKKTYNSLPTGSVVVNVTTLNTLQGHDLPTADDSRQFAAHLQKGDKAVQRGDLDSAEQHFAAALKLVHVRDPTGLQYAKEVSPLHKLGDVYCRRGCQTGDGGDFVKAAALYQAAVARSGDERGRGNLRKAVKETEILFHKFALATTDSKGGDSTREHKLNLREMRDKIRQEMETINKELNPYMHDEESQLAREIEAKRAYAVRQLFEKIAEDRKEFIGQLVDECIAVMGSPPCKYALIGLGSQATGLVTPYSDLEFAILVEDESEANVAYFRRLTHYLHLKVVNLGETILPALGIESLNDFYSDDPLDNWFYDSVTPRGFAFDGSMPKASKTPLGRRGTSSEPPSELIRTPRNMAGILEKDASVYLKEGYHLAGVLRNVCLISGEQKLVDDYAIIVAETLKERDHIETASSLHNIGVVLFEKGEFKESVKFYEQGLQMRKTLYGQGTAHGDIAVSLSSLGGVWHALGDPGKAIRYRELALHMYRAIYGETAAHPDIALTLGFLAASWKFVDKNKAISYAHQALEVTGTLGGDADNVKAIALTNLGSVWWDLGEHEKAISCNEEALQILRRIFGENAAHPRKAANLNNLGTIYGKMGLQRKAISYLNQVLDMDRQVHGPSAKHADIAQCLGNLGAAFNELGEHREAAGYLEQALEMYESVYGPGEAHAKIAGALDNLGFAYSRLGDTPKARRYSQRRQEVMGHGESPSSIGPGISVAMHSKLYYFDVATKRQTEKLPPVAGHTDPVQFLTMSSLADKLQRLLELLVSSRGGTKVSPDIPFCSHGGTQRWLFATSAGTNRPENWSRTTSHQTNRLLGMYIHAQTNRLLEMYVQAQTNRLLGMYVQAQTENRHLEMYVQAQTYNRLREMYVQAQTYNRLRGMYVQAQTENRHLEMYVQAQTYNRLRGMYVQAQTNNRLRGMYVQAQTYNRLRGMYVQAQTNNRLRGMYVQAQTYNRLRGTYVQAQTYNRLRGMYVQAQTNNRLRGMYVQAQTYNRLRGMYVQAQTNNRLRGMYVQAQTYNRLRGMYVQAQTYNRLRGMYVQAQTYNRLRGMYVQAQTNNRLRGMYVQAQTNNRLRGMYVQAQTYNRLRGMYVQAQTYNRLRGMYVQAQTYNRLRGMYVQAQTYNRLRGMYVQAQTNNRLRGMYVQAQTNNRLRGMYVQAQTYNRLRGMYVQAQTNNRLRGMYVQAQTNNRLRGMYVQAQTYNRLRGMYVQAQTNNRLRGMYVQAQTYNRLLGTNALMFRKGLEGSQHPQGHSIHKVILKVMTFLLQIQPEVVTSKLYSFSYSRQYAAHLQKGDEAVQKGDLDSAEQHFAAALKMVHVRDPTVLQCEKEVSPLHKLGDVYCRRGCQTGDGGDFVKAAALYQAAVARSEKRALKRKLGKAVTEAEILFLRYGLAKDSTSVTKSMYAENIRKHKNGLMKIRDQIRQEIETINKELNPYIHDEESQLAREIEAKRADAVRKLFEKIAEDRKEFIGQLVDECVTVMGPPPCKYAMIGLGSQATGLVTPYSDLEFAILVEEENEANVAYCRRLTHYLHLKVVNLGETILPALGIESLNDFFSDDPLDSWFYDSVTPRGFAFDGSMPKASKTPLGRQETSTEPSSELIRTPRNMAGILETDALLYLKEGYHLCSVLRNVSLMVGQQSLVDDYLAIVTDTLKAEDGEMARKLAKEIIQENLAKAEEQRPTSALFDVKKEIYRFPSVAVDCLALCTDILPSTVWKTIDDMETTNVISAENAHHLKVLVSISAELRLRTYIANGGQKENLSALSAMPASQDDSDEQTVHLQKVFYISDVHQLFRYYFTATPLKTYLSKKQGHSGQTSLLKNTRLFDNSPVEKGGMYTMLGYNKEAIECCENALDKGVDVSTRAELLFMLGVYSYCTSNPDIATSYHNVGLVWIDKGDYHKAIRFFEKGLKMRRNLYGQMSAHPDIAVSFTSLGAAWHELGNPQKAISYRELALKMYRMVYGETTAHPTIAHSLSNLGASWNYLDPKQALIYLHQGLGMTRDVYGDTHPDIAHALNNIGSVWWCSDKQDKAVSCYEEALQILKGVHGQHTPHPNIASSLNNLGTAWSELGDDGKAMHYYEEALEMYKSMFGPDTAHSNIANILNNLGGACNNLGLHRKALEYFEQALDMFQCVFGRGADHPRIADTLNNMGFAWHGLGDYRQAMDYFEQALKMHKAVYGETTANKDIAYSLKNLAVACTDLRDYQKAIGYYEQSLQMFQTIYDSDPAHPRIAATLEEMGFAWRGFGNHRNATEYFEQALEMFQTIHGNAHPHIVPTLNYFGITWLRLGENRKAIHCFEKALQMQRNVYGARAENPAIAASLTNLASAWYAQGNDRKARRYTNQARQMERKLAHQ
ncbi:TTC28 [Branchiostoma lanceolatum]|uniref:TTC28 protein n=1 Tax=Branchiostoma lanceolatum TaxID=7740 RepID=A0A8K0AHG3_BRALA|nr:TTC28 [Branchiostoma lanceolatum]